MNMKPTHKPIRYVTQGLIVAVATWGSLSTQAEDHNDHSIPAGQVTSAHTKADRKDVAFIKEATKGALAEIEMGRVAFAQGQNQQVKELGQRLQQDHGKANQELTQIALKGGVNIPTDPSWKSDWMTKRLEGKSGAEFDKAFTEHAIKDHGKDIEKYQEALHDVKDPELKAFIERSLPVLRQHLTMARTAGAAVGVDQKVLSSADRYLTGEQNLGVGASPRSQTGTGTDSLNRNDRLNDNVNRPDSTPGELHTDKTTGTSVTPKNDTNADQK